MNLFSENLLTFLNKNYSAIFLPLLIFFLSISFALSVLENRGNTEESNLPPRKALLTVRNNLISKFGNTLYYWNRILKIHNESEKKIISSISPLSIKIAEIYLKNEKLKTDIMITDKDKAGFKTNCILVIRIQPPAYKKILSESIRSSDYILNIYRYFKPFFEMNGCNVSGIQIDADIPTSKLSLYSQLLTVIKSKLEVDEILSITTIPDWFESNYNSIKNLLKNIDFHTVQFYSNKTLKHSDETGLVLSEENLEKTVKLIQEAGCPYYLGISIFGAIHRFDSKGVFIRSYFKDISIQSLLNNRNFILVDSQVKGFERIIKLQCIKKNKETSAIFDKNDIILISSIEKQELKKIYAYIEKLKKGKLCIGAAWFRYCAENEFAGIRLSELKNYF